MPATLEANGSVFDDFRAVTAGTSLSGRTSDSGHTWTVYRGSWSVVDDGAAEGRFAAGSGSTTRSRAGIDFGVSDVSVEAYMRVPDSSSNSGGIMFRRTASGYYRFAGGGGGAVDLRRSTDGGSDTTLGTGTGIISDMSVLRVVCSGSTIDCYLNDVLEISVTDSTYGGTVHGIWQSFGGSGHVGAYAFNMHPVTSRGLVVGYMTLN